MLSAKKVIPSATRADLEQLPSTWRGEIIDDTLYAFPRPRFMHANVEGSVQGELYGPFQRGRGGPGGWWIVPEPGIELPRAPEFSPDIAGWRRERMPRPPGRNEPVTVVPDWICEVLSPSTASYDQIVKRRFYAEIGVAHLWYVDPAIGFLEVCRLVEGKWLQLGVYGPAEKVRAEPFDAIVLDLVEWWEGAEAEEEEP